MADSTINAMEFTPDGRYLLTCGINSSDILRWNTSTGEQDVSYSLSLDSAARWMKVSPAGSRIGTIDQDLHLRLWDAAAGTPAQQLVEDFPIASAAFSPDGTRIVTVPYWQPGPTDASVVVTDVMVWNVASGEKLLTLDSSTDAMFTPDGKHILTLSRDGEVLVWDAATGAQGIHLPVYLSSFQWNVYVSPDSRALLLTQSNQTGQLTVQVWSLETGEPVYQQTDQLDVRLTRFSLDGQNLIVAGADGTLRVWNIAAKTERLIGENTLAPLSMDISPDGQQVVTTSSDGLARLWAIPTDE